MGVASVSRSGKWYQISYIWGPGHVLISLRLSKQPSADPDVTRLDPIGGCDHGEIDPSKVKAAVSDALHAANEEFGTKYGCTAVRYVANDSPRYDRWAQGTRAIVEHLASGGECSTGASPGADAGGAEDREGGDVSSS